MESGTIFSLRLTMGFLATWRIVGTPAVSVEGGAVESWAWLQRAPNSKVSKKKYLIMYFAKIGLAGIRSEITRKANVKFRLTQIESGIITSAQCPGKIQNACLSFDGKADTGS